MWRTTGPCREEVLSYADDITEVFSKEGLFASATHGDQLIHQRGRLYPALMGYRESEMRANSDQIIFADENRSLFPTQYTAVMGILRQGVREVYDR